MTHASKESALIVPSHAAIIAEEDGNAKVFLCIDKSCQPPIGNPQELTTMLDALLL
jgi:hypothetical protein